MYKPEFAACPHRAYAAMRKQYGSLVPVEIAEDVPATLVIELRTAIRILNDPAHFSADPRTWQKTVPGELSIRPMVEWRPNALRNDGENHSRYREATNDALGGVDLNILRGWVERAAIPLINSFCSAGQADVIRQYILPLQFTVLNDMLGCPPEIGERVAHASAQMFEGQDSEQVNEELDAALLELINLKRTHPGDDVTTRLTRHPAALNDQELINALVTCYSAGIEPPQNLMALSLKLMLTDNRFVNGENGFALPTSAALDEILATDPPLANYCITYPKQPIVVDRVWLPANEPVMVSMAACSNDPNISNGEYNGNRWHLGWGRGPHECPANAASSSYLIANDALDQLLDTLPELRLAVPENQLEWRPGPFHRALAALPVVFPPSAPFDFPPAAPSATSK